jgi:phage terminase large subunit
MGDNMLTAQEEMELIRLLEEEEREREYIDKTNPVYVPLYTNANRYIVLVGGAGSGKSIFAGQKLLKRITTESGHRILVVRKVARTLRESCFQQLRGQISELFRYEDFEINKTDMKITYKKNKNEILFAGLDDVEKLKSIYNVTSIWIEEASELEPEDFRQLDIRLRGETKSYKQFIVTFNPVSITHWLKAEFFDSKKPDCVTLHTTYKDNKFLDNEAIRVLESFRDTDPYYYQVYCQGEWGVLGKTIFNAQLVTERIMQLRKPRKYKIGYFAYDYQDQLIVDSSIRFIEDSDGYIKIYEDAKINYPYVIGGDTAGEGTDSSDYFVGQVIDNSTGIQVATLRHRFDEDLFARQMYCLGKYYNNALIGIEINFGSHPVKELERLRYYKMYQREQTDTFTGALKRAYGFRTDKMTRPLIIAELVQIVRENVDLINDMETLEEMLTFVKNEQGRAEAQNGKHDDCIMSLAIAYHIRTQQSHIVETTHIEEDDDDDDRNKVDNWFD